MFVIIGWVLVLGAVIGSFVAIGGHLAALVQPFELMCIFGSAFGAFIVSNPMKVLKATAASIPRCFKGGGYTKEKYLQLFSLLYELLQKGRMLGMLALENDVEEPKTSPIFTKYPIVMEDHHLLDFITDYLRMLVGGNSDVTGVEDLMDNELNTHHDEMAIPSNAIQKMADGLPAFGIVSAVMGVVHTMGSVGKPPAVLGELVAAALVGTFLGILLGYGFVGPLASLIEGQNMDAAKPYQCVKAVLIASMNGYPPALAVEFGRKVLFHVDRPNFYEVEKALAATKEGPAAGGESGGIPEAAPA